MSPVRSVLISRLETVHWRSAGKKRLEVNLVQFENTNPVVVRCFELPWVFLLLYEVPASQ